MPRFRPFRVFLFLLLYGWVSLLWAQSDAAPEPLTAQEKDQATAARAINLLSFVAVDYPEAVVDSATRDARLYRQLQENVQVAAALLQQLPDKPGRAQLANSLQELDAIIEQMREPELVRRRANAAADRIAALYQVPRSPAEMLPPPEEAEGLYRERCSRCHGIAGRAPQPERRLDDPNRMGNFSLYDFYNALEPTREDAHGQAIDGDLSSRQRWALAVLVAGFSAPQVAPSAKLAEQFPALVGPPGAAIVRPAEIPEEAGNALRWWRAHPQQTRHLQHPLARAAGLLYLAQNAYRGGDNASAYHQLMLAMREGFAPARAELMARNPALVTQLDQQWQELRQSILDQAPANEVIEKFQRLQANVVRGREQLQPTSGAGIYGWAALLFLAALGVGLLLWYGLRRPRRG
ncbi:hypothetical protein [Microbulbifer sp. ALW1]|uniref:hypothetical protein n=1 Tax=Microbulbifer sp. (strain ALW1) TaxID=1516059 RepID=UPI00135A3CDE|nr:hypothetical protein [Microbulbifer sp. ALW1]